MRAGHLAVVAFCLSAVAETTAGAACGPATAPADAVALYRRAFDLLPKLSDLSEQERQVAFIDPWAKPTAEEYAGIARKAAPALELLRQATSIDACDWGQVPAERQKLIARVEPYPEHLSPLANLARYSRLRARWHAQAGRYDEAYRDLADQLVVARHASRTPTTSAWRVQASVSGYALEDAAWYLPQAPPVVVEAFVRRLDRLPAHGKLADAMAVERKQRVARLSDLLTMDDGKELAARQARLGEVFGLEGAKPLPLDDLWDHPEKQEKVLQELDGALAALEKRVALPDAEYTATREQFLKGLEQAHPLVRRVAEEAGETWTLAAYPRARLAMLRTAIDIRARGPGALKESRDPFGDGPFKREEIRGGYRLVSGLEDGGMRTTLTVGRSADEVMDDGEAEGRQGR